MRHIGHGAVGLLVGAVWCLAACGPAATVPAATVTRTTPPSPPAVAATATATPAPARPTAVVQRGEIGEVVTASGFVTPLSEVDLALRAVGVVKEIHVKPGDRVTSGQPLVSVDSRELELHLTQAEASLATSQAKHEQARAGATPKEIEQAEAAVRAAGAQYQQVAKGTVTPQDIANAEAALRAAEARLAAAKTGTVTPQDIANAEAALRSAQAKLAEVQAGSNPASIDVATQKLNLARDNRAKVESQLATAKEQARLAVEQAASAVRAAQAKYAAAKLVYEDAERASRGVGDARLVQLKADYEAAEQALKQAEQSLEQKQLAYEDAKQQEVIGIQTADNQILQAQAELDGVKAAPAKAAVDQAQATVDQAKANLEKLRRPPKESDVAEAQAAVDQMTGSLEKLRRGPEAEALAAEQAKVDQARAALNDLRAGPKASDLAVALAAVKEQEAARELQRYRLDQAVLTAPFDGVIAAVNVVPGQVVTTGLAATSGSATTGNAPAGAVTLVDDSQLRVNVRVAEGDIARVRPGQAARIGLAALPEHTAAGTVTAIAPRATVQKSGDNEDVAFLVTVTIGEKNEAIRPGMTAVVDIATDRKQNALLVPSQAVHRVGRDRVVEVLREGETTTVPVQVGSASGGLTEILSGLHEGDIVVNARPAPGSGG